MAIWPVPPRYLNIKRRAHRPSHSWYTLRGLLDGYLAGPLTLFEHRFEHVTRQSRIFSKPAYRISVPIAAKWNIHAQVVARGADDIAQLLIDAKQHLKFVRCVRQLQFANDSQSFPDHQLVMRRDADIGTISQQLLQQRHIVSIDNAHVVIRDLAGLDIDAFA